MQPIPQTPSEPDFLPGTKQPQQPGTSTLALFRQDDPQAWHLALYQIDLWASPEEVLGRVAHSCHLY